MRYKTSDNPIVIKANAVVRAWTAIAERERLVPLAREVLAGGMIVEIGCLYGGTTAVLALANPDATVFSIDRFDWTPDGCLECTPARVADNMHFLGIRNYELFVGDSRDVGKTWNRPIDLLWVDGYHAYDVVKSDLDLFGPHAKVIALHDYGDDLGYFSEVKPAVDEFIKANRDLWHIDEIVATVAVLRKRE